MSDHTHPLLEREGPRANITFRTEAGINVASIEFMSELETVVDELAGDNTVRFVVLQAEGKVFLAGANIKAMIDYDPPAARRMAELGHRVLNKIEALPQVTIAAIHGAALGGGCELAMACDFRFAVKTANIGQPEVLLGLIPGWAGTARLPRLVPLGVARRMMFTGDSIEGQRALAVGLVDDVVNSAEDLAPLIRAFTDNLIKAGPAATGALKRALRTGEEIAEFAGCFGGGESAEGMRAFLEKRPASWTSP